MKKEDLLLNIKSSGNLDYGAPCLSKNECDSFMTCSQSLNDLFSRCRCISPFIPIVSLKTGLFECGKALNHALNNRKYLEIFRVYLATNKI